MKLSPTEKILKKSKIEIVKTFNAAESPDFEGGFLVYNPKGSGDLRLMGGTGADRHSHELLLFRKTPLLKIRSKKVFFDEETEREVAAGAGLAAAYGKKQLFPQGLSEGNITEMLAAASGLLNSLYPSLYFVLYRDFWPASGDGGYFQSLGTGYRDEPASVPMNENSSDINDCLGCLLPLRPEPGDTEALNRYMLAAGRGEPLYGVALSLGGGISVLFDGHSRAAAAAMLGKKLRCFTVVPAARHITKGYNKYSIEYASLSATVKKLPEGLTGEGFLRASDCDRPVAAIGKLLSVSESGFDAKPLGELEGVEFPVREKANGAQRAEVLSAERG